MAPRAKIPVTHPAVNSDLGGDVPSDPTACGRGEKLGDASGGCEWEKDRIGESGLWKLVGLVVLTCGAVRARKPAGQLTGVSCPDYGNITSDSYQ